MSLETIELCRICHKPRAEHKIGSIIHKFVSENQGSFLLENDERATSNHDEGNRQGSNQVDLKRTGSDAILRLALMRKGLIEVADLEEIERELRTAGAAGYDPSSSSNS